MNPESIINAIKDLPLKEALGYLIVNKIFSFNQSGFESIKEIIREKVSSKKYGFVPNKDEGNFLVKASERQYYREFGRILPNHRYSDLIRTGYLVTHLNKLGGEANKQRAIEIKESVLHRPNGVISLRIVQLVTTGALVPVVDYLDELKKKNYDLEYLSNTFDEVINDWKKYACFIKSEMSETQINNLIMEKIEAKQKLIMLFSYGFAKKNTTRAVASILKNAACDEYFYESKNVNEGDLETHVSSFSLIE